METDYFKAIVVFFVFTSPITFFFIAVYFYNKFKKEKPKEKEFIIPEELKFQVEQCLNNRPVIWNEFKSFKKYEVGFYKNLRINNSLHEFEKNSQILFQTLKYFQKLWSIESLEIFFKELKFPENILIISEIHQRPMIEFNNSELTSIQLICSKPNEYLENKNKFFN